jgi:hypothetical protein
MTSLCTFIHTWAAIPCSTWRKRPSWPCPRVGLSPSLTQTYLVSTLFVLAHPVACCLSQRFLFHTYNPPFTTRGFNTFIQVNIMGARYNIYNRLIHILQLFFLCFFLTSGQAGWPQTSMSATENNKKNLKSFLGISMTTRRSCWQKNAYEKCHGTVTLSNAEGMMKSF